ncbi:excalibur calcium-binding domain-containing protein, partial [Catellatospora sp. NPDC049609]|uniref:excalibur calcium-binding domain-containing protein n=1 Tax=Catellatospora sp. NPDC049609 TaxID=3155505 RepID=UPI00344A83B5
MSPVPTAAPSSPVAVTSAPASPTPASAASPKPVYYANCDAVRRAGKAPLRKGSPGYRAELDRDRDGLACESSEGSTTSQPKPTPKPPSGNDPRFSTCKAAKSAGYGPYRRGVDPEYSCCCGRSRTAWPSCSSRCRPAQGSAVSGSTPPERSTAKSGAWVFA